MKQANHISVCVCTYRRPELLKRLLDGLRDQETGGLFTYSVVVVDNDSAGSAEAIVREFELSAGIGVTYCVEPRRSIALARNQAIRRARGGYVVFIDDDEFPISQWLLILFSTCQEHRVDGVLGPVKPHYDVAPPRWVIEGKFYERKTYPTGLVIDWRKGRTGNTLLRREVFDGLEEPFNPEFRTGEDQEFFHRMIQKGFVFIWCNEAVVYEVVPPVRWQWKFMLRRALLRGAIEPKTPCFGARDVVRSLIAVTVYSALLPVSVILGRHRFMMFLVRLCDHLGKLLAVAGIHVVKEAYVTE